MNKEELIELIPFYVAGTLEPGEKLLVERELVSNADFRRELEFWKMMHVATNLHFKAMAQNHISAEEICTYARGELANDPIRRSAVERHLETCGDCKLEVEALRTPIPLWNRIMSKAREFLWPFELGQGKEGIRIRLNPAKLGRLIPVAAAIIAGIVLLNTPGVDDRASIRLAYLDSTRGPSEQTIPQASVTLKDGIKWIDITFIVDRAVKDSMQYTMTLFSPEGDTLVIPDEWVAQRYTPDHDSVHVDLERVHLGNKFGTYRILLQQQEPPRKQFGYYSLTILSSIGSDK